MSTVTSICPHVMVIITDPEPSLLMSYVTGGLAKLDAFTRTVEVILDGVQIEAFDYHYGYEVRNYLQHISSHARNYVCKHSL